MPEFPPEQIKRTDGNAFSDGMVKDILSANNGQLLIPVLNIETIDTCLRSHVDCEGIVMQPNITDPVSTHEGILERASRSQPTQLSGAELVSC